MDELRLKKADYYNEKYKSVVAKNPGVLWANLSLAIDLPEAHRRL
jgi:hypothetical protein